jgi:acetyl esterase/lipase
VALLLVCAAAPARAASGAVVGAVPGHPDPAGRYVIYLHGRILELQGRNAVSPEFGRYEYDAILRALSEGGVTVISELRGPATGVEYAKRVASQVRELLAAGVRPEHVSVVGFSKGGYLARAAAAELQNASVRFAILAGCPTQASEIEPWVPRMRGRVLSLYDVADKVAGSCLSGFAQAPGVTGREVVLGLGLVLEWISH